MKNQGRSSFISQSNLQYADLVTIVVSCFGFVYSIVDHLIFDIIYIPITLALGAACGLTIVFLFRVFPGHILLKNHLIMATYMATLTGTIVFTGGYNNTNIVWIAIIPLIASTFLPFKHVLVWLVLSVMNIMVFFLIDITAVILPNEFEKLDSTIVSVLNYVGVTTIAFAVGVAAEKKRKQLTTENLELQQINFNQSKVVSMGELAGGVAHEINNPLAIVKGKISRIRRSLSNEKDLEDHKEQILNDIQKVDDTIKRITDVIESLREISGKNAVKESQSFSLKKIVSDVLRVSAEGLRSKGVTVHWDNQVSQDRELKGSKTNIGQVVLNLINNATEASQAQESQEKTIELITMETDQGLSLTVKDHGKGIEEDVVPKIFDPFFTTRTSDNAPGLGLSLSRQIVESHGGTLTLESPKSPTSFKLFLPYS